MRKFVLLAVAIVLVVGGWTGAWFWARGKVLGEMDAALDRLQASGTTVTCPERSAGGWPFRLEISCLNPQAALADGRTVTAPAAAATWHVVDPKLVVVEAASPVSVSGAGVDASAAFDRLRASLRLEDLQTGRISVEVDKAAATVAPEGGPGAEPMAVTADRAELHLRPTPGKDGSLDVALVAIGLDGSNGGAPLLPAAAEAGANLTILNAAQLGALGAPAWAAAGGRVDLVEASLAVGETRITAAGGGTLEPDGSVTATLDAVGSNISWLTAAAKDGKPLPAPLAALGSAFLLLGRPLEGDGTPKGLTIAVDAGAVSANGLALGTIPPLRGGGGS